jgi:DNA-binding response OmpR family regulator
VAGSRSDQEASYTYLMRRHGAVLIVNSFDGCAMYAEFLRLYNFRAHESARPEEAFACLEDVVPDVIVTDLVFRGSTLDGASFIRALRGRVDGATSIIVITGLARQEDRERAQSAGADLFLIEPVLPHALLDQVKRALALRRRGRRLPWNWHAQAASAPSIDRRCAS